MDNLRQLFVGSLNLAVAASWLIVVLLLLRPLLKKLAPKWVLCALWALVRCGWCAPWRSSPTCRSTGWREMPYSPAVR